MNADVAIIGAGPAGIFTALEMLRRGSRKKIILVEKGQPIERRVCPKAKTKKCMNCKPYCHITTGFSGAGAFSDGKLSLSCEVGGELPTLIGEQLAQETIEYTDKIYLEFGADERVEGISNTDEVKDIRKRAIQAGLKLVDCPIRHLGTEKALRSCSAASARTSSWRATPAAACTLQTAKWDARSVRSIPLLRQGGAAPTGWSISAPSTISRTSRARWISACA